MGSPHSGQGAQPPNECKWGDVGSTLLKYVFGCSKYVWQNIINYLLKTGISIRHLCIDISVNDVSSARIGASIKPFEYARVADMMIRRCGVVKCDRLALGSHKTGQWNCHLTINCDVQRSPTIVEVNRYWFFYTDRIPRIADTNIDNRPPHLADNRHLAVSKLILFLQNFSVSLSLSVTTDVKLYTYYILNYGHDVTNHSNHSNLVSCYEPTITTIDSYYINEADTPQIFIFVIHLIIQAYGPPCYYCFTTTWCWYKIYLLLCYFRAGLYVLVDITFYTLSPI